MLFSLLAPAPDGFSTERPSKPDLLRGVVAVLVHDLSDINNLLPDFEQRVHGLVITYGGELSFSPLGPQSLHLVFPADCSVALAPLCQGILSLQKQAAHDANRVSAVEHQLRRLQDNNQRLRLAYDATTTRLAGQFEQLRNEVRRREQAEDSLLHAEKMRAIGQMAGGIAHDFNNLLGSIIGAAELLEDQVVDDEAEHYRDMILQAADRAATLTARLLAFGRRAKVRSAPFDLHNTVETTISMLRHSAGRSVGIDTDLAAAEHHLLGDEAHLQNALLNLGTNAAQAMPAGGQLTFSTRRCDPPQAEPEGASRPWLELLVSDTGSGISPDVVDHIFEPFFTTKGPGTGTGLGLAAVYGTIQEHRGTITVDSTVGEGTSFSLRFPTHPAPEPTRVVPSPTKQTNAERGLLLVIEDETLQRQTLRTLLRELGFDVLLAEDGEAGLKTFQAHHTSLSGVILDMVMPYMTGRECFYAMRELDPAIPVLLTSGYDRDASVAQMEEDGLAGYLPKPYRLKALEAALLAILRTRPTN